MTRLCNQSPSSHMESKLYTTSQSTPHKIGLVKSQSSSIIKIHKAVSQAEKRKKTEGPTSSTGPKDQEDTEDEQHECDSTMDSRFMPQASKTSDTNLKELQKQQNQLIRAIDTLVERQEEDRVRYEQQLAQNTKRFEEAARKEAEKREASYQQRTQELSRAFSSQMTELSQELAKTMRVSNEAHAVRLAEVTNKLSSEANARASNVNTAAPCTANVNENEIDMGSNAPPPTEWENAMQNDPSAEMTLKGFLTAKSKVSHATPQVASLNFERLLEKVKKHSETNRIRSYAIEERANIMLTFARVNEENLLTFRDWDSVLGQGLVTLYGALFASKTTTSRIRAEQSQIETGFIAAPGELSRANYQRRARQAKSQQGYKKAPPKSK